MTGLKMLVEEGLWPEGGGRSEKVLPLSALAYPPDPPDPILDLSLPHQPPPPPAPPNPTPLLQGYAGLEPDHGGPEAHHARGRVLHRRRHQPDHLPGQVPEGDHTSGAQDEQGLGILQVGWGEGLGWARGKGEGAEGTGWARGKGLGFRV